MISLRHATRISTLLLGVLLSGAVLAQTTSSSSSSSSSCSSYSVAPPAPTLTCTVNSDQPWGQAYQAMVDVTNTSDYPMSEWEVYLNLADGHTVNHYWDANVETAFGTTTASNATWNGNLQPGQMVRFGIMGSHPGDFVPPTCTAVPAPNSEFAVDIHGPTVYVYVTSPNPMQNWEYQIDFGEGGFPVPSTSAWHTYAEAGEYTITVTAGYGDNLSSTTQTIVVSEHAGGNHAPVGRLYFDVPYGGSPNSGSGLSYDPDGDILSRQLNSASLNGRSYVVLTVFDGQLGDTIFAGSPVGCGGSYHSPPTASFTYQIVGRTVKVDAHNSYGAYLEWDFGDGAQSDNVVTSHTYSEPGEYTISVSVYGGPHRAVKAAVITIE